MNVKANKIHNNGDELNLSMEGIDLEEIKIDDVEWDFVQPPSPTNPQKKTLVQIEKTLRKVESFLRDPEYPWPLRKQVDNHKTNLLHAASYLSNVDHNIAVIGDIGVGKSTAISFIFELLKTAKNDSLVSGSPILETGAGGTTICEVHIKSGNEFGLKIEPMFAQDIRNLVSDFANAKWAASIEAHSGYVGESVGVSREVERAIRNMSGLTRKKVLVDGKKHYQDPVHTLIKESHSEQKFCSKVLELMNLEHRVKQQLWYDSATRLGPTEWLADVFKKVNNGRMSECPLPSSIDLLIPNFDTLTDELDITVIDTKGVDDLAVREDLDLRLRDQRTATVFCCRFNDAPGTSAKSLLQHMRETMSDTIEDGKVLILVLPREGEALSMKDDIGELAETTAEGYDFKGMQLESEFASEGLENIGVEFIDVGNDNPKHVRQKIISQISKLRNSMARSALESCEAAIEIMDNHEAVALSAAVEEVSNKLINFIQGTPSLSTREKHAHQELTDTINSIRYASTLWAATRRSGKYSGLNAVHLLGVGASKEVKKRVDFWYAKFDAFLASLENDKDLVLASKTISSVRALAKKSKLELIDEVRAIAIDVYDTPLTGSGVWEDCAGEWGQGPGFKTRVTNHLDNWFDDEFELKESLEKSIHQSFAKTLIEPLKQLTSRE